MPIQKRKQHLKILPCIRLRNPPLWIDFKKGLRTQHITAAGHKGFRLQHIPEQVFLLQVSCPFPHTVCTHSGLFLYVIRQTPHALILRMSLQKFHSLLYGISLQHIVAVRPDQIFSCHKIQPSVNGRRGVFMLRFYNVIIPASFRKSLPIPAGHVKSIVRGSVVHQYHLQLRIGLDQYRIQKPGQISFSVIYRSNHRNHSSLHLICSAPCSAFTGTYFDNILLYKGLSLFNKIYNGVR